MTYNQLFKRVYGNESVDAQFWSTIDGPTKMAWAVFGALGGRKGFDSWFDDLDTRVKNEIFNDVRNAINGK